MLDSYDYTRIQINFIVDFVPKTQLQIIPYIDNLSEASFSIFEFLYFIWITEGMLGKAGYENSLPGMSIYPRKLRKTEG